MKQKGMTLIELLVVMVIIAVVIAIAAGGLKACSSSTFGADASESMYEDADVLETIYTPPTHTDKVKWTGKGSGWSEYDTQPVYGVLFKCTHGQFVSQGADARHKQLWEKLPKGTHVRVEYKELTKGGRLVGYDFIDATPAEPEKRK